MVHKSYTYVGSSVMTLDSSNVSSSALGIVVAFPLRYSDKPHVMEHNLYTAIYQYTNSLPLLFAITSIAAIFNQYNDSHSCGNTQNQHHSNYSSYYSSSVVCL